MKDFKGRHFEGAIILWAVRWYCKYGVGYRELKEMLEERGVSVDHSTIYRWTQRYAPEIEKRLRWYWRRPRSRSWRVDETDLREGARPLSVSSRGDRQARRHHRVPPLAPQERQRRQAFPRAKALRGLRASERLKVTNTDKAATYGAAIAALKKEGKLSPDPQHRQVQHLNNPLEADHGKLKRLIRPTLGFPPLRTAFATIRGFEVMRALKKGQSSLFRYLPGVVGEVSLVHRAFGLT